MYHKYRLILWIAILASLVTFLDGSIVNVALPAITHELGGGFVLQQWVVDAYAITLGSLMLVAGSLADIYGRKRVLIVGLIGFGVTSLLCAAAPTGASLVVGRALQGVAGAIIIPSSLALIMSQIPPTNRAAAIGSWTAWTGIAFIIGPLIGGLLVDAGSWRYVFVINVIPIVITIWLLIRLRITVAKKTKNPARLDVAGALLCAGGLGASAYALIEQSRLGWANPLIYSALAVGCVSLIGFIYREHRARQPMMPLKLFHARNFTVGNIATLLIYAGLSLATFIITIFVQQVGGYRATEAGLAMIPVTILMFFLSSRFGKLSDVHGPRWFMAGGPALAAVGFLEMLLVDRSANYLVLLPGILLFGIGLSITVAPLTSAVLSAVTTTQSGIASAVNNAISRIAGLVAVAAIGSVVGHRLGSIGFHRTLLVIAALMLLGALVSALGIKNTIANSAKS